MSSGGNTETPVGIADRGFLFLSRRNAAAGSVRRIHGGYPASTQEFRFVGSVAERPPVERKATSSMLVRTASHASKDANEVGVQQCVQRFRF